MPQMSPLNWLNLFMFFILVLMMFNIKNFFYPLYQPTKNPHPHKPLTMNWKW